jgi:SAM-dependent methyltransferase
VSVSLREAWESNAADWLRFTRTAGHDIAYHKLNLPHFLELLPPPGRRTLDLGCGEGRLGAELAARGHNVVGVDTSPTLVAAAAELHDVIEADASALPFQDGSFDLVYAFMSLHDMDDAAGAIREAGRVLERGGRFCFALEHPRNAGGEFAERAADAPFVWREYLGELPRAFLHERDGITMQFRSIARPLESYSRALEAAGLLVEAVREPVAGDEFVGGDPARARWRRIPMFIQLRAVKP